MTSNYHLFVLSLLSASVACGPSESTSSESNTSTETETDSDSEADSDTTEGPTLTDTEGTETEGTETEGTDTDPTDGACSGENTTGDEEPAHACGCTVDSCSNGIGACDGFSCSPKALMYSVTYCAADSLDCGPVLETCGEFDCAPEDRIYDETALDCTLTAMRDRAPGMYAWDSTLDGHYSGDIGVFHLGDGGAMWARQCNYEDFSVGVDQPSGLDLESAAYFDGCLAMPEANARWLCLQDGLIRTDDIATCNGGTGGPPPLGTCPNGGVAWAGSAIFHESNAAAIMQMEGVECIEGPLLIDNPSCPDALAALSSVSRVDGAVTLRNLDVPDMSWLSSLTEVEGNMSLRDMPVMSLDGLDGLTTVEALDLRGLPNLSDLQGLGALANVETLNLADLNIQTLAGLGPVHPNELTISESPLLTSIVGLELITNAESLSFGNVPALTSFEGLENLKSAEYFSAQWAGPADLTGLQALESVTSLTLAGDYIVDAGPLPSLTTVEDLWIRNTPLLTSLSGLANISQIAEITLSGVPSLVTLSELSALQSSDSIELRGTGLVDLNGLNAIENLSNLNLIDNVSLTSVSGLDALTAISEGLSIGENPKLVNLMELLAPAIGGTIRIYNNKALISLAGLEGVTAIVGDLDILGNEVLNSLAGLANLQSVDGNVEIRDNPQLPNQDALDFAESLEVSGFVDVSDNG
ncbi:MAG: hypothetical protein ACPG4T_15880 [Nannocystaceae bacterium]